MLVPQIVTKTVKTVVDGQVVSLGEVQVQDPRLMLSTYEVSLIVGDEPTTVELSYLGEGTITVTNPNPTALSATYDSVTRTITLVGNQSSDVNLTVSLSRSGSSVIESVTLTAHCSLVKVKISPNLTFSNVANADLNNKNSDAFSYDGDCHVSCHKVEAPLIVEVSRLGDGIISATTDVEGNDNYFKSNCGINVDGTTVKINTSKYEFGYYDYYVVRISVAETSDYLSEYKDINVMFWGGPI